MLEMLYSEFRLDLEEKKVHEGGADLQLLKRSEPWLPLSVTEVDEPSRTQSYPLSHSHRFHAYLCHAEVVAFWCSIAPKDPARRQEMIRCN